MNSKKRRKINKLKRRSTSNQDQKTSASNQKTSFRSRKRAFPDKPDLISLLERARNLPEENWRVQKDLYDMAYECLDESDLMELDFSRLAPELPLYIAEMGENFRDRDKKKADRCSQLAVLLLGKLWNEKKDGQSLEVFDRVVKYLFEWLLIDQAYEEAWQLLQAWLLQWSSKPVLLLLEEDPIRLTHKLLDSLDEKEKFYGEGGYAYECIDLHEGISEIFETLLEQTMEPWYALILARLYGDLAYYYMVQEYESCVAYTELAFKALRIWLNLHDQTSPAIKEAYWQACNILDLLFQHLEIEFPDRKRPPKLKQEWKDLKGDIFSQIYI